MACSYGNTLLVQYGSNVMRMSHVHHEGQDTCFAGCRSDDVNSSNGFERLGAVLKQRIFMGGNLVEPQTVYVIDGSTQTDGSGYVRCSSFKFIG